MKNCLFCETSECDQRGVERVIPDWSCPHDSAKAVGKKPLYSVPQDRRLRLVTIHLPEAYLDGIEQLVNSKLYPNRSEAIRVAIRDMLKDELWGRIEK